MLVMDAQAWRSISEVAVAAGVSRIRVRQLMQEGRLRGVRTTLGWLIDPQSVLEWERERALRLSGQRRRTAQAQGKVSA